MIIGCALLFSGHAGSRTAVESVLCLGLQVRGRQNTSSKSMSNLKNKDATNLQMEMDNGNVIGFMGKVFSG